MIVRMHCSAVGGRGAWALHAGKATRIREWMSELRFNHFDKINQEHTIINKSCTRLMRSLARYAACELALRRRRSEFSHTLSIYIRFHRKCEMDRGRTQHTGQCRVRPHSSEYIHQRYRSPAA